MKKFLIVICIIVALVLLVTAGIFVYDYIYYEIEHMDGYYDDEYDDDEYYDDEYYEDESVGFLSFLFGDEDEYNDDDYEYYNEEQTYNGGSEASGHSTQNSLTQLVVLLNFKNQDLSTDEKDWHDFYFGSSNSVATYFNEMSKGKFIIVPANESYGTKNDGVIVVDIDRKHPNLTSESSDREYETLTKIFEEMLEQVDDYIDFSKYDKDGDGNVLATELTITMIASGYEENDYSYGENQVSGICINEDYYTYVDGVGVGDYILCGELDMNENGRYDIVTIGIACHETAHVLGLPDLYDTDYSSIGLGFHSLMSEGCNNRKSGERYGETPSPLIAWCKIYVGFAEPEVVTKDGEYTLYGQSTDDYNIIKIEEGDGYYLIENIDFNGYGAGIKEYMDHSGIAIWYIDESVMTEDNIWDNEINNDDNNRGVVLIEAEDKDDLYEESLDYDSPEYDHYFAKGYVDEYVTEEGTIIKINDEPGKVMNVTIDFDN